MQLSEKQISTATALLGVAIVLSLAYKSGTGRSKETYSNIPNDQHETSALSDAYMTREEEMLLLEQRLSAIKANLAKINFDSDEYGDILPSFELAEQATLAEIKRQIEALPLASSVMRSGSNTSN